MAFTTIIPQEPNCHVHDIPHAISTLTSTLSVWEKKNNNYYCISDSEEKIKKKKEKK